MEQIDEIQALLLDCRNMLTQCESSTIGKTNINVKIIQINNFLAKYKHTHVIDWSALREKFFNECTDYNRKNSSIPIINMVSHNVFEWFKNEIINQLKEK